MADLKPIDDLLESLREEAVEGYLEYLSKIADATTSAMIARVPTPLMKVGNKKCDATGGYNAFTFNPEKNGWDLCGSDEEIMWSSWGHVGEGKKKKNETGTLGFIARRGMLPAPERAV